MLGVPASFVELRHEATHRDLPSLVVLRNAAQRSLDWLWEFYWAKLDYDLNGEVLSAETKSRDEVQGEEDQDSDWEREREEGVDEVKNTIWSILQPFAKEKMNILKITASSKGGVKRKAGSSGRAEADMSNCLKGVISLCCQERQSGLGMAQVLLGRENEVIIPGIKL